MINLKIKTLFVFLYLLCYNYHMIHIAILQNPFFDMILNGTKTIESRWSMHKIAPYQKVKKGDTILLKETGKLVTAKAIAKEVKFFELTPEKVEEIRLQYGKQIGTDKFKDWKSTLNKKYCTLIWLDKVEKIQPLKVPRSNGAGWILIKNLSL